MSKEIYISSTPHETRLAIVENDALTEIYYERENEYTLAGSIYNGKVTRVLPGMQSSFVDIGLERDAFLYITDFMEEAGDSADFETNGDGDRRSPRRDGRDRNQDRGDRSGNRDLAALPAPEGSTLGDSEESAPRTDRGNDRGDRRGRGRRDRNRSGNRDRQPRTDRPEAPPSYTAPNSGYESPEENFDPQPVFSSSEADATFDRPESASSEAAPAPEGNRRWRGRRGRRRGRGPGDSAELRPSTDESLNDESPNQDFQDQNSPNTPQAAPYDTDLDYASEDFELDAAAAVPAAAPAPRNTAPIEAAYSQPQESRRRDRPCRPASPRPRP